MSDECNCCGKRQYSAWDHILRKPRYDRIKAEIAAMEVEYEAEIKAMEVEYEAEIKALEAENEALDEEIKKLDGEE